MGIHGIEHVLVAIPRDGEDTARSFYVGVLGMTEVAKPPQFAGRGGLWLRGGTAELHLGVEDDFRPASRAHPAFLVDDLASLLRRLQTRGHPITRDVPLAGYHRAHVLDPFGNRLELMQRLGDAAPVPGAAGRGDASAVSAAGGSGASSGPADLQYPLVDLALARRLERTEAAANAAFVEARAELHPGTGAEWTEVAGAYAMFDGVGSPLTQTFGLGLFDAVDDAVLEELEAFFRARDAEVFHEISPVADPALLGRLSARGYSPVEFTSVLYRPTAARAAAPPTGREPPRDLRVRRTEPNEADLWARVAAEGWSSESAGLESFMLELGRISARARGAHCFLAELGGEPIAAGALNLGDGVALLAGASTVPAGRRNGAQAALLDARLRFAAERGCALAVMGARPGSASQRNAQRQGFRIAYTRVKWRLARAPA
jgi:catechol 2,3-dioxygenase-like lactoylglutathione lyase family enzyme